LNVRATRRRRSVSDQPAQQSLELAACKIIIFLSTALGRNSMTHGTGPRLK
jgi:hypothetical protein